MSTLNVAVADEKKNMQSLLKGMEFLGTARSSDEAYNMINGNAGSDVVLVYVKRASGDTEPLDDTYMEKKSLETQVYGKGKPTNSEFIALITDKIRLGM